MDSNCATLHFMPQALHAAGKYRRAGGHGTNPAIGSIYTCTSQFAWYVWLDKGPGYTHGGGHKIHFLEITQIRWPLCYQPNGHSLQELPSRGFGTSLVLGWELTS